jgi:uncharacterized protein (DUF1800 family)
MSVPNTQREIILAMSRFGLGAGPKDIAQKKGDPRAYLRKQQNPKAALLINKDLPSSDIIWRTQWADDERRRRERESQPSEMQAAAMPSQMEMNGSAVKPDDKNKSAQKPRPHYPEVMFRAESEARLALANETQTPFLERLVSFWSNHFAISVAKSGPIKAMAGAFEREAIRPFILGKFVDLLIAVEQHPAMILYLDNQQSIGPHSRRGDNSKQGLNENLAREILELHALGSDGGYSQTDVINFASVITGWTVNEPSNDSLYGGRFTFAPARHEPGDIKVMGKTYPEGGKEQGEAVLRDLARHPSAARFIARKLATAFISDNPPKALLANLEAAYRSSDGDLMVVTRALIDAPESWQDTSPKLRSPYEFIIAAMRAMETPPDVGVMLAALASLGQPLWQPSGPNGFPDNSAFWMSPDGMSVRLDIAAQFGHRAKTTEEPDVLLTALCGTTVSTETRQTVARADSREQALAMILMSPEFQRR